MRTALLRAASPLLSVVLFASCGPSDPKPMSVPGIVVPRDYPTPQDGIDVAESGDTVYLEPGVYTAMSRRSIDEEEFPGGVTAAMFLKEGVAIEGLGGLGGVIFADTTESDSTFGAVFNGVTENTVVHNVVFDGFFCGALFHGDSGTLSLTRVSNGGVGAWAYKAGQPWVLSCLIENTRFDGVLNQLSDTVVGANIIRNCTVGVGSELGGRPIVQWNILCSNQAGAGANTQATPILYQNVIIDNSYAGVKIETGAIPIVFENDIYDNAMGIAVGFYAEPLADTLNCTSNFWDTTDLERIGDEFIMDRSDDPTSGAYVDYLPVSPISFSGLFLTFPPRNVCGGSGAPLLPRPIDPARTLARVQAGFHARP